MATQNAQRTYTIDVWEDESIWTWEGVATSEEEAEAAATDQLNQDWDRGYASFEELRQEVDGTALIMHPAVMAERIPQATLDAYRGLEALLRQLSEDDMPHEMTKDDRATLAGHLATLADNPSANVAA